MYAAEWKIAVLPAGVGLHLRDSALDRVAELPWNEEWQGTACGANETFENPLPTGRHLSSSLKWWNSWNVCCSVIFGGHWWETGPCARSSWFKLGVRRDLLRQPLLIPVRQPSLFLINGTFLHSGLNASKYAIHTKELYLVDCWGPGFCYKGDCSMAPFLFSCCWRGQESGGETASCSWREKSHPRRVEGQEEEKSHQQRWRDRARLRKIIPSATESLLWHFCYTLLKASPNWKRTNIGKGETMRR